MHCIPVIATPTIVNRAKRKPTGTVTVQDVAQAAGVSAMTVSRVINAAGNVQAQTRERVLAAIAKLNYTPNTAARALAAGFPLQIGLLYANPSDSYLNHLLLGALRGARGAGCHLVVEPLGASATETAQEFADARVSGVILPPLAELGELEAALIARDIAFVTIDGGDAPNGIGDVRIDDRAAAMEMTRHLIALGHRRIAFIAGNRSVRASAARLDGFRCAAREAGIDAEALTVQPGQFTYGSGIEAMERILAVAPRPTAVFAANDDMAAAAVGVAHRYGLHVPDDVTIVGFDDTAIAINVWPALTTIRQPIAALAEAATGLLLQHIGSPSAAQKASAPLVLPHLLVRRSSDGSPRVDADRGAT